jgi:hypothetical protein
VHPSLVGITLGREDVPGRALDTPDVFGIEREERCAMAGFDRALIGEALSANRCFTQGQRLWIASRIAVAPALSEMPAGVRLTIRSRPSVSTAMCRLRPTIFFPAS